MSIPEYIAAIRDGDYERGLKLLYETNPFSHVCGGSAPASARSTCAASHEGDPIAIRWLKRHITEQVPTSVKRDHRRTRISRASGKGRDRRRRPGRADRRLRPGQGRP
jgi:NADPH-dependent glutamate synthase beta subunit-like oxidoreductase